MSVDTSDIVEDHVVEYRTYVAVWAALLALTGVLVGVSLVWPALAMWAMVFVTPLKAGLVLYYFMHLKYEPLVIKAMVFAALATLVVFIAMTFLDVSFR